MEVDTPIQVNYSFSFGKGIQYFFSKLNIIGHFKGLCQKLLHMQCQKVRTGWGAIFKQLSYNLDIK